jgi:hypothetical protein
MDNRTNVVGRSLGVVRAVDVIPSPAVTVDGALHALFDTATAIPTRHLFTSATVTFCANSTVSSRSPHRDPGDIVTEVAAVDVV